MKRNNFVWILMIVLLVSSAYALTLEEAFTREPFEYNEPTNITRDLALQSLLDAEQDLDEMEEFNLSVFFVNDQLLFGKRYFVGRTTSELRVDIELEEGAMKEYLQSLLLVARTTPNYEIKDQNYSEVIRIGQVIEFRQKQAYEILDTISLLEIRGNSLKEDNVDTDPGFASLDKAKQSFANERYDDAISFLEEADFLFTQAASEYRRIRDLLWQTSSFFIRYWWQIILIIIFLIIITKPLVVYIRRKMAEHKLETLKLELEATNELIKKIQVEAFKDKTMTEMTYKIMSDRYKKRINEIKRNIPALESVISGEKKSKNNKEKEAVLKVEE